MPKYILRSIYATLQITFGIKTKPMGYKFRRQHPISGYILDFYCHKLRLSIEVDGKYHMNLEQKRKDKERTKYLNSLKIKEIRFKNDDIIKDFKKTLSIIQNELENASLYCTRRGVTTKRNARGQTS